MLTKTTKFLDQQGRVMIPSHFRKELKLTDSNAVDVILEDDGSVRIRAAADRCCICGEDVDAAECAEFTIGTEHKLICRNCAKVIVKAEGREEE